MVRALARTTILFLLGISVTAVLAGVEKRAKGMPSKEKAPYLILYRTLDGMVTSAVQVTLEETGAWEIGAYGYKGSPRRGVMTAEGFKEFAQFFETWRRTIVSNGWVEPDFGGCTNPLDMGAVRWGDGKAAHYRRSAHEGGPGRPGEFQRIYEALEKAIPELTAIAPFDRDSNAGKN
jgi:hypothetical protein